MWIGPHYFTLPNPHRPVKSFKSPTELYVFSASLRPDQPVASEVTYLVSSAGIGPGSRMSWPNCRTGRLDFVGRMSCNEVEEQNSNPEGRRHNGKLESHMQSKVDSNTPHDPTSAVHRCKADGIMRTTITILFNLLKLTEMH